MNANALIQCPPAPVGHTEVVVAREQHSGCVLVVDDEEKNRRLLREILLAHGYDVIEAANGVEALQEAEEHTPDAILLDVMMPDLDGFEVCRRLKGGAQTASIPVLMVTALQDRKSLLLGIDAGAMEFLTKPVDPREISLRVRNAVHMKHQQDELEAGYAKLLELEQLRDRLVHMIVHDMRSPLMVIDMGLQIAELDAADLFDEPARENLKGVRGTTQELIDMVTAILDVSKLESESMILNRSPQDLLEMSRSVIVTMGPLAGDRRLAAKVEGEAPLLMVDSGLIERVLVNLLTNAIRHTHPEGHIRIQIEPGPTSVLCKVVDDGRGIPRIDQARVFEKFGQVDKHRAKYSTGLGLTFCRMAVEAHGGEIGLESDGKSGSTFWFRLPLAPVHEAGEE